MPLQVFGNNCLIGLILAKKISGVKIDRLSYLSVKVVPASSVLPPVMYASSLPVTANIYTPYKQPQSARREDRSHSLLSNPAPFTHDWLELPVSILDVFEFFIQLSESGAHRLQFRQQTVCLGHLFIKKNAEDDIYRNLTSMGIKLFYVFIAGYVFPDLAKKDSGYLALI